MFLGSNCGRRSSNAGIGHPERRRAARRSGVRRDVQLIVDHVGAGREVGNHGQAVGLGRRPGFGRFPGG